MEIIPVKYGRSVFSEGNIFEGGDPNVFHPIWFIVYLIKLDGKLILVDAGCETMSEFDMKDFCGSIEALKKIGIAAEDITDVIITHAHHDHIECVKYFKNAVIHIQREEYEEGKVYIPSAYKINVFDESYLLYEKIRIIKIGGHTKGSCVVEVEGEDKKYLITGDECYLRACWDKKMITPRSLNRKASVELMEKYREGYNILLCHDE